MRISDWSSDVCSSDLLVEGPFFLCDVEEKDGASTSSAQTEGERIRPVRTWAFPIPIHSAEAATVIVPFGHWPRMAGEYIASTRVGGRVKRPDPVSRTPHPTEWVPAGNQAKTPGHQIGRASGRERGWP